MCVLFLPCLRLVIEDMDVAVANLEEVDVPGNHLGIDAQIEASRLVVRDIIPREKYRYLHRDCDRVVKEHEALQRLMAFPVVRGRGQRKRREARCVIFFSGDARSEVRRKLRRALDRSGEQVVRIVGADRVEVGLEILKAADVGVAYQHVELRFVHFKAIHLTVLERVASNELTGREEGLSVLPQPRVGSQLAVFGDPGADRPLGYMNMEPLSD